MEAEGMSAYTSVGYVARFAKLFNCAFHPWDLLEYLLYKSNNIFAFFLTEWMFYEFNFVLRFWGFFKLDFKKFIVCNLWLYTLCLLLWMTLHNPKRNGKWTSVFLRWFILEMVMSQGPGITIPPLLTLITMCLLKILKWPQNLIVVNRKWNP